MTPSPPPQNASVPLFAASSPAAEHAVGYGLIVLSAVAFGAMAILARYAYQAGANTGGILLPRFVIATGVLIPVMLASARRWPRGRELAVAFGMGGIGYVGQALCFFSALQYASAGLVALLLYLYPTLVGLLAAIFLGERLTPWKLALLGLSFAGTALTIGSGSGTALGIALGISAATIYAVYITVGGRFLRGTDSVATTTVVCLAATPVMGLFALLQPARFPASIQGWLAILGIALLSTVVAIMAFFAGLRRVGASRAAIVSTLEPVVTLVLAALLLGESATFWQLVGGAMILAAAALAAWRRDKKQT